jgi:tetratricopeptide (TPR) repeat protein
MSSQELSQRLAAAVTAFRAEGDMGTLQETLATLVRAHPAADLAAAAEPYRTMPEVAGPIFEKVVEADPDNAKALVALANAYWLAGRGPEKVGELASRAIGADPTNRAGWHLWCLSESDPRERTIRWRQVVARFPDDDLARATLADSAASLAGAEKDREALALAISEYEILRARAARPEQREALDKALTTLRAWSI